MSYTWTAAIGFGVGLGVVQGIMSSILELSVRTWQYWLFSAVVTGAFIAGFLIGGGK